MIDASEESPRCDEIERASVFVSGEGARRDVVPLPETGFAPYSGYDGAEKSETRSSPEPTGRTTRCTTPINSGT